MQMCFVLGLYFGSVANCKAPALSSKTVEYVLICLELKFIYSFKYSAKLFIGKRSQVL